MNTPASPIARIVKRSGVEVPYDRARIATAILKATTSVGPPNPALADEMALAVEQALMSAYPEGRVPSVEDIQDVVESVLMSRHHTTLARNYIIYRHQRALARQGRQQFFEVADHVPYRKIYEVLLWNLEHRCDSVAAINAHVAGGTLRDLIAAADARYNAEIAAAAEQILERRDRVRMVIIAGPSSSGKTTTTIKIGEHLARAGYRLKALNVDHYYFNLEQHPRDEFGDYDYETPQALDLALINEHLRQLLDGKTVRTPHYDFKVGKRTLDVHEMTLAPNEMLLLDSLHGLYEGMTGGVPGDRKFRVYIETLGQLRLGDGSFMRWADNRLLRRMIRDKQFRNYQPLQTLTHWHYVRRSELTHIIPFIKHADIVVNSALPYELPFLKARLFEDVERGLATYGDDPTRLDAGIRIRRVHGLLAPLAAMADDRDVAPDALLREFIGGSRYVY